MAAEADFRHYQNAYQSLTDCDEDIGNALVADPISVRELQTLLEELDSDFGKFNLAWERCEASIPVAKVDEESRKFRALKRSIRNRKATVERAIETLSSSTTVSSTPASPTPVSNLYPPSMFKASINDFPIPEFDGEPTHWHSFWDSFSALIDSRTDISNVAKFNKLKSHLRGRALQAVASFPITDDCYKDAINRLKSYFVDDKFLLTKLHNEAAELKKPQHNLADLSEFHSNAERIKLQIKKITGKEIRDPMLADILSAKLSKHTLEKLFERYGTLTLSLTELLEGVEYFVKLMIRLEAHNKQPVKDKQSSNVENSVKPKPNLTSNPRANSSHTVSRNVSHPQTQSPSIQQSTSQAWTKPCIFCQELHSSKYCKNYATYDARRMRVRDLNLCFCCMKAGHLATECRISPECRNCHGKHHTFLCMRLLDKGTAVNLVAVTTNPPTLDTNSSNPDSRENLDPPLSLDDEGGASDATVSAVQTGIKGDLHPLVPTALPTAIVELAGGGKREQVRMFLDQGSQRTFISTELVARLQLKPVLRISIRVIPFGNQARTLWCDVVSVVVRMGTQRITVLAVVYDEVSTSMHIPGLRFVAKTLRERGIKLADPYIDSDTLSNIPLIIGADNYTKFVGNYSFFKGVTLLASPAGSLIFGPMPPWATNPQTANLDVLCARVGVQIMEPDLHKVPTLWDLETVGILPENLTPEEKRSVDHFESTVQRDEHQYWVALPWKGEERPPSNYRRALGQLTSLKKSFVARPKLFDQYESIFQEYLKMGFIEKVETPVVLEGSTHYLPHHAVMKDSPTTPCRVVFNAASKPDKSSKSLNECLLTGPTLTNKLVDTLIVFRTNPVAAVADISKAFLRIGLLPEFRDYCRFLWFEDATCSKVCTLRFKSVLFGVSCSPFLLQKTLCYHLETHPEPSAKSLIQCFYVDNFACTHLDVESLRKEFLLANRILGEVSMPLQGWISNSDNFNNSIGVRLEDLDPEDVGVLGLSWNVNRDSIRLRPSSKVCKEECMHSHLTKRIAASVVASVYDPLGLVSPVVLKGKLFLKTLWETKYAWDAVIPEPLITEFKSVCHSLKSVSDVEFPRFAVKPGISDLHVFCDASQAAYGLVAYSVSLRDKSSYLLVSKARVAPNPRPTIPKLELLSLTLASRLADNLMSTDKLSFNSVTLWCDNEVALTWTNRGKSTDVFVRNRVAEIDRLRTKHDMDIWYVPTKQNPADIVSRGAETKELTSNLMWLHGPAFLVNPSEYPPQKEFILNSVVVSEILVEPHVVEPIAPIFDMEKYSSLIKVKLIVAYVQKFCRRYFPNKFKLNPLLACVRLAQRQSLPTLFTWLKQPEQYPNPPTEVKNLATQLDLYLDINGIIRSKGRLQNSDLSLEAQYPMYLPAKHPLTELIITHYHQMNYHCGLGQTLMGIRQQFWLSKARVIIKNVISKCVVCRRTVGRNALQPGPPPLPEERVKFVRPFSSVGIDYTGTITVLDPESVDDNPSKVYVCLFTCTTSRAIHLELCRDLTTAEFLCAFRRFAARFGIPSVVFSDNGTNFRGAERFLEDISEEPEVVSYLRNHDISWRFNTPRSPWSGGFFERLIGCVKSSLHKALYKKRVSFTELHTILCEIECIVNSRPLTYLSEDIREDYLSPSHLIYGRVVTLFPPLNSCGDVPHGSYLDLRVQYSRLSDLLKRYENLWKDSYLTSLRERHQSCARDTCSMRTGDLVLLDLENKPRAQYPLGIITQLIQGNDGVVRSAVVRARNSSFVRPVSKLIPLELHHEETPDIEPVPTPELSGLPEAPLRPRPAVESGDVPSTSGRPKRAAARRADQMRQDLIQETLL